MAEHQNIERDRLIVLDSSEETAGESFRFEYLARTVTDAPPNHVHDAQEERVEVLAGSLSIRINDHERVLGPGERLTFPPGVPHAVWNADPSGSRTVGEFRPALDTEALFKAAFADT